MAYDFQVLHDLRELFSDDKLYVLASNRGLAVSFDDPGPTALLVFTSSGSACLHADQLDHSDLPTHSVCEMSFAWLQGAFTRLFHDGVVDGLRIDLHRFVDFRAEGRLAPIGWVEEIGTSFSEEEEGMFAGGTVLVVRVCDGLEWTISVPVAPNDPNGLAAQLLGSLATREPGMA